MRECRIGGHGYTRETLQWNMDKIGLPILRKTEETINHFQPKYYVIENTPSGEMQYYIWQTISWHWLL